MLHVELQILTILPIYLPILDLDLDLMEHGQCKIALIMIKENSRLSVVHLLSFVILCCCLAVQTKQIHDLRWFEAHSCAEPEQPDFFAFEQQIHALH